MKHVKRISILLVILMFILCACSTNDAGSTDESTATSTDEASQEMDVVNQLIFGTMMLDGTNDEITTEQAEILLPLWKLYESMMAEDATASEELDAIINQIKSALSDDQLAAMADLDYTNMMETMSGLGLETLDEISDEDSDYMMWGMPGGGDFEDIPEDMMPEDGEFDREDMPEGGAAPDVGGGGGGDMGSGGNRGGGGGMGGGEAGVDITGDLDPETLATAQASGTVTRRVNTQTQLFLSALIEYLELKAE